MDPMGIYYGNPVCLPGVFSTAVTCRNGIPWGFQKNPIGAPMDLAREEVLGPRDFAVTTEMLFCGRGPYEGENLPTWWFLQPI